MKTKAFLILAAVVPCFTAAPALMSGAAQQRIDPPAVISYVPPIYPEAARQRGTSGDVVVEATIGPDGKVTDVRVVKSIPDLDEAAMAAVRQWEYAPTVVGGVAMPVLMTVTVSFTLTKPEDSPAPVTTPDLSLRHDGKGWSINGYPIKGAIADALIPALETRRDKRLVVEVPATFSYPRLIEVLIEGVNSGVEGFLLMQPNDSLENAVAVQLHIGPGLDQDLTLVVADVTLNSPAPDLLIRLPARSAPEPSAAAVLQKAGTGAVVGLQVDAQRQLDDIWQVLSLGKAHGVEVFSLEVERAEGPGVLSRRCRAGSAEDCMALGFSYLSGSQGLAIDYGAAVSLLRQGCDGKSATSCGMLAEVYEQGVGVSKNPEEALRLHNEACRLGGSESCDLLRDRGLPVPPRKPGRLLWESWPIPCCARSASQM